MNKNYVGDFPILSRKINGQRLVYLDNAATTQKPQQVINSDVTFYKNHNANIHRGIHTLSEESTHMYEEARNKVANFIGARVPQEVIFTANATDSLNMAASFVNQLLKENDLIVTTEVEHHSNIIPWQELARQKKLKLQFVPVLASGLLNLEVLKTIKGAKVLAITHASNVTGEIVDIKNVVKEFRKNNPNALVVVDGAQAVPHTKINVQSLDCDFYAFSAHKMVGPTGVGVLWGRQKLLEELYPVRFGGGMISEVYKEKSIFGGLPDKFEAGTPNVAGAIGLGAAVDYLSKIGIDNISQIVSDLGRKAVSSLKTISGLNIVGADETFKHRSGVVSFTLKGVHPHDLSAVLDSQGVAVRTGHHCAMILHNTLKIPASTRASFYFYNTEEDIQALVEGVKKAKKMFGV